MISDLKNIASKSRLSKRYKVNESFPHPIALLWKGSAFDSQNGPTDHQQSTIVFPKENPIPSVKAVTIYKSCTFTIDVVYSDAGESQASPKISTYTIGPFQSVKGEHVKVKVKLRLNLHGVVSIESAIVSFGHVPANRVPSPILTLEKGCRRECQLTGHQI